MTKSYRPHMNFQETKSRSIIKSIIWRVVATLLTWGVIYFFNGSVGDSLKITLWAAGLSMIVYYIHERIWNKIKWGKV